VSQRDGAELLLIFVMLGDCVDERAAVETFLAKPWTRLVFDPNNL